MATNTYVALNKATISNSTTSTVTFSSIPSTYTDLVIVFSGAMSIAGEIPFVRFNGDTTTVYSISWVLGDGASSYSYRRGAMPYLPMNWLQGFSNTTENNIILNIQNYANTSVFKTCLERSNNASSVGTPGLAAGVGLWRSTAAITSIEFYASSGYFVNGATVSLYGIKAEGTLSPSSKATGGTITTDQFGYVYHTFTSGGTFTPSVPLSCDVLVVAGGGGGGGIYGGGGGAGGLLYQTGRSVSSAATVTVGGGGSAGNSSVGGTGTNSTFDTITALGGGGGGWGNNSPATTGGSGGGGAGYGYVTAAAPTQANSGGAGGYGFAGGSGGYTLFAAGGGGGAGGVGGDYTGSGTSVVGGNGGIGFRSLASWASTTSTGVGGGYAGGGGGGTRVDQSSGVGTVSNGGGLGGRSGAGTSATSNTGGGGGGAGEGSGGATHYTGGAGGSGIVIVRYYGA